MFPEDNFDKPIVFCVPDGVTAVDLVGKIEKNGLFEIDYDLPFFVANLSKIVTKFLKWQICMPGIHPFYAIKCNGAQPILSLLSSLGCSFDCASKVEIQTIKNMGLSGDRIIYANPAKPWGHVAFAMVQHDVRLTTFDSEDELQKIIGIAPDSLLLLRIRVVNNEAMVPTNLKFGCDPQFEAPRLIKRAAELKAGLVGICFHVGTGCQNATVFKHVIAKSQKLMEIGRKYGLNMSILDLGGGFPGCENFGIRFETMSEVIRRAIDKYFPDSIRVIAEPGRYFVDDAFTLFTSILKKVPVNAERITGKECDKDRTGFMYYINDGFYGSFSEPLAKEKYPGIVSVQENTKSEKCPSMIWGPTCSALDNVCSNIELPEMNVKNLLAFNLVGAYTSAICSNFNGFPKAENFYMVEQKDRNIIAHALPSYTIIDIDGF